MSDREAGQNEDRSWGGALAFLLIGLPLLLFLPLLLSITEHTIWRTNRVEDICRDWGIHGFLSQIYEPIISVIRKIF